MGFCSLCSEIGKPGEAAPVRCAQSEPPHKRSFCQCLHFPLPFCFSSNPPVVLLAALVSLNIIFSAVDGLLKYEVHKSLDNVTSTAVSVLFSLSDRPAWHGGSTGPGEQHPRTAVWLPSAWDIAVIPRGTARVGGLENQHWALLSPANSPTLRWDARVLSWRIACCGEERWHGKACASADMLGLKSN